MQGAPDTCLVQFGLVKLNVHQDLVGLASFHLSHQHHHLSVCVCVGGGGGGGGQISPRGTTTLSVGGRVHLAQVTVHWTENIA